MELLHGLVVVVVATAAVIAFGLSIFVSYFVIKAWWPLLAGAAAGYFVWMHLDNDLGIVCVVAGVIGQFVLYHHRKKMHPEVLAQAQTADNERYVGEYYFPRYFDQ
ncbi:MAG: hypothetical protein AB8G77_08905 [Rhodothermales bacterium]